MYVCNLIEGYKADDNSPYINAARVKENMEELEDIVDFYMTQRYGWALKEKEKNSNCTDRIFNEQS
jgi:hypothetical protein